VKRGVVYIRKRDEFEDVLEERTVCVLDVIGVLEALNAEEKRGKELLDVDGVVWHVMVP
jgi:hypothetical protein